MKYFWEDAMSVIAHTIIRPLPGKRPAVETRVRHVADIYSRHGASVKTTNFIAGPDTGCIGILRGYPNFRTAVKTLNAVSADPEFIEFEREREANPQAEIVSARNISRHVFGESKWATHPVTMLRHIDLSRRRVPQALELLSEMSKLLLEHEVNVLGLLPVTGDNMSSMTVSHQFHSMEHNAEVMDAMVASDAMQALIAKGSEFGTLRSVGLMVPL